MTRSDRCFEWMCKLIHEKSYSEPFSYRKLLRRLHDIEFSYLIPMDQNREEEGIDVRDRYSRIADPEYSFEVNIHDMYDTCSVLEMMVALAVRCEETMDDPHMGDRTGQWFWGMIKNLGLGSMTDGRFDIDYVNYVVRRLLERDYEPDGKGGLFTVRNCDIDLRDVEIWYQLCWYLDSIT